MLEGITICVDYADYLEHTLPYIKNHFDKFVVVTTEKDLATQKVCDDNGIEFVITNRLYEDDAKFNKGKGLNDGFKKLSKSDWIVVLDSDIILKSDFRDKINSELHLLNKEVLYGTKRMKFRYYEDYIKWKETGETKMWEGDPVICSGFFQLFNANSTKIDKSCIYPETVKSALGDITFRSKWDEKTEWKKTESIDYVLHLPHSQHLEVDKNGDKVKCLRNWYGRKTLPFNQQTRANEKALRLARKKTSESIEDLFT
jgi:hypothetical protein